MNRNHTLVQTFSVPVSLVFIEGQVPLLNKYCLTTHVITSGGRTLTEFAERYQIRYDTVPYTRSVTPLHDLFCLWRTYQIFRRIKPVIVHGNTPKAGLLSMLAARLAGVPVRVYEIHGFPFESRKGPIRWLLMSLERLSCQAATHVLAVSNSLRTKAVNQHIVPAKTVTVPHNGSCNGVDALHRFNPATLDSEKVWRLKQTHDLQGPVVGFVGRLTRDKGIIELAMAWKMIREDFPNVTLLLIGPPELEISHEKEIIDALVGDTRARQIGFVPDVEYYYALLDFLLLPTYREGFGNVVLEAAAMEVPSIVSRVTGTVDAVVENETGLFCEPYSAASLAAQIRFYLNNKEKIREHGRNARVRVLRDFDPVDVWKAKYAVYEKALQSAGFLPFPSEKARC
ncbi:glycosyltransferase family 4 protein [Larkinella punicea]|uniref:Glycosyltransferase family 1 protein n=1 Tax=Larkinella punicea TaxID=2315727 RepID=A0A368JLF5_9BACT|nr:glycosyltransferase family 4 protein [Larkinella punicea]RCR68362.1 glycosyltransferase family 1 protein [Larkinella punicea]